MKCVQKKKKNSVIKRRLRTSVAAMDGLMLFFGVLIHTIPCKFSISHCLQTHELFMYICVGFIFKKIRIHSLSSDTFWMRPIIFCILRMRYLETETDTIQLEISIG